MGKEILSLEERTLFAHESCDNINYPLDGYYEKFRKWIDREGRKSSMIGILLVNTPEAVAWHRCNQEVLNMADRAYGAYLIEAFLYHLNFQAYLSLPNFDNWKHKYGLLDAIVNHFSDDKKMVRLFENSYHPDRSLIKSSEEKIKQTVFNQRDLAIYSQKGVCQMSIITPESSLKELFLTNTAHVEISKVEPKEKGDKFPEYFRSPYRRLHLAFREGGLFKICNHDEDFGCGIRGVDGTSPLEFSSKAMQGLIGGFYDFIQATPEELRELLSERMGRGGVQRLDDFLKNPDDADYMAAIKDAERKKEEMEDRRLKKIYNLAKGDFESFKRGMKLNPLLSDLF